MSKPSRPAIDTAAILDELAQPVPISKLGPMAARFIYALRLIALHERARHDPVPELATRLGNFEIAVKTLAFSQSVAANWPENIHLSRFCCQRLTHDEATIGALVDRAWARDRSGFEHQVEGLIRPERVHRLWDAALALVAAEASAA